MFNSGEGFWEKMKNCGGKHTMLTTERDGVEFLNYQIKVIITKYAYSCFATHIGTKNSSVAPFCRPYVVSIVS